MVANENRSYNIRWFIWGILAVAYIIVFFHRVAVGVVVEELTEAFNITKAEIGNIGSMYFYAYMIMQIPSGILADTLGARKTVTIGILFAGIGSVIFGFATNMTMIYLGRTIVGLGVSVVFISTLKILSGWFKEDEFGRMSGLTSFIGNGGSLLAQYPLVLLVAYIGWEYSFAIIGVISLVVGILAYIIIKDSPKDAGLKPLVEYKTKEKISIKDGMKIVFLNKFTWPGFFVFGGMFGSLIAFMGTWGVSYIMNTLNVEKAEASTYTMTVTLGLMIGSLVVGTISDKIGKRKLPLSVFSILYLLSWVILLYTNIADMSSSLVYMIMFVMGFTGSGFVLSWASSKEVNPPHYSGLATGTVNMGGFLFAAVIMPLIGTILDKTNSYSVAFLSCLIPAVIAVIATAFIKETNCKNIY